MNYGDIFTIKEYGKYFLWAECYGADIIELEKGVYQLVKKEDAKVPTREDVETGRANEYGLFVDPITCHIQRLEDEQQTPEIMAKIAELRAERSALLADIQSWFPYPEEPVEAIEEPSVEPVVELYSMEI